ncbi:MAG: glycosyltransferase, partial [Chitinophagaceae bacterium]
PPYLKSENENFFLYVGRLSEEKGIRLLLSVFSGSRHALKIIGDGPLLNEVEQAAAANNNIQFLGSKTKAEVFELLGSCTALIFPSIWFEGMPLTIIEAFACGTPVITSELGAMEFMVTPNVDGLHFKANDKEDMTRKLELWEQLPT